MAGLVLEIVEGSGGEIAVEGPVDLPGNAQVRPSGDAAVVEDRGSESGTYVNDQLIDGPHVILPGDRIRVGLAVFELRAAGEPAPARRVPEIPEVPDHVLQPVPDEHLVEPGHDPSLAPFRAEETPAAFVPPDVDAAIDRADTRLLRAWRDTRVKEQTHLAAFGLLAVAGLAVGMWLGFR